MAVGYVDVRERSAGDIAAVVDSMQMPVVVLFGVETKGDVERVVATSQGEYSFVHRHLDYYDGRDFALLYFGDAFFVERVESNNYSLSVVGEYEGESVAIDMTRRGDRLRAISHPEAAVQIACGNISSEDIARLKMYDPLLDAERKGYGELRNRTGGVTFRSRIGANSECAAGVYSARWLATQGGNLPLPLYLIVK